RGRRAAECGQQFPSSDGDCHTPLPCEARRGKDTTPRVCCVNRAAPGAVKPGMDDEPVVPRLPRQSALMPANLTTLPHFSVSSAMSLPKSADEPGLPLALDHAAAYCKRTQMRFADYAAKASSLISASACSRKPARVS